MMEKKGEKLTAMRQMASETKREREKKRRLREGAADEKQGSKRAMGFCSLDGRKINEIK